jgi:hypothetical protein
MGKIILEREIQGPTPWFGGSPTWRKDLKRGKSRDQKCNVISYKLELDKHMATKPLLFPNQQPMIDNLD